MNATTPWNAVGPIGPPTPATLAILRLGARILDRPYVGSGPTKRRVQHVMFMLGGLMTRDVQ